jgi:hypothetical protein
VRDGTYPVTITFPDLPAEVEADGTGPIQVTFEGLDENEWSGRIVDEFRPHPVGDATNVVVVVEIDGEPHLSSALYDPTSVVELRGPRFSAVEDPPDI